MTTVLIFVGIPLAVIAALALLIYGAGIRRARRYRPGRPFEFAPVWFVSAARPGGAYGDRPVLAPNRPALSPAEKRADTASLRPAAKKGGARGTW